MLYSKQIKAARAIIDISQLELANLTHLHVSTIQKIEKDDKFLQRSGVETMHKIKKALENQGVKFLNPTTEDITNGVGIRYFIIKESGYQNTSK